jgi:hypothetical protein
MSRPKTIGLTVLAVTLPVALALGAYLVAGTSLGEPAVPPVPAGQINTSTGTETPSSPANGEDVSGNCDEPEHANDAECRSGKSGSGSGSGSGGSGSGSNETPTPTPTDDHGGGSEPGDDNGGGSGSGSGSDGSGSNSGPGGSGGDDHSGPGGGDD